MTVIERKLAHCTAHGEYAHDCPWCRDSEMQVARATRTDTAEVMAANLKGAVARADAAEGRISLAERRLQFAFQRAGIEVDAQALEGFVKHAAQHIERGDSQ